MDLPETVPIFRTADKYTAYQCTLQASKYYNVSPYLVQTLLQTEGGVKGSKVKNTNGTYDYGPMQINTIWVNELKRIENVDVNMVKLQNDICYNIYIGSWILSHKIEDAGGDPWKGLGNYHSKTTKYHNIYMKRAVKAYKQIVGHWARTLNLSNNALQKANKVISLSISPD